MDERTTNQGTAKMRTAARCVVQVAVLALGIATLTAGTANSMPPHVRTGSSGGGATCSALMDGDRQGLVAPPYDSTLLPFHPY